MCGIAGFHVKDPKVIKKHEGVELLVDKLLLGIEHRGKHATGFVSVGFDGKVELDKAAKTASDFIKDRSRVPEGVRTVLLHTRAWTKGDPSHTENNHPVVYGHCFAVHNGHINNDDEIFEELDLKRNAEVDSIAIAASASYEGIGELEDIKTALERLEGGFATAIIDPVTHPGRVVLAKGKNSPLYIVDTPKFLVWASTQATIKDAWAAVLGTPPADKKIESITEGNFLVVDDGDVTREKFTVKQRPFAYQSARNNSGSRHGNSGSGFGFRAKDTERTTGVVAQAREEIAAVIKAGGTARHFDDHQNGLYAEEDFSDVQGARKWHPCFGCNRLVIQEDIRDTEWGRLCIDCSTGVKRALDKNRAEMQDDSWGEDDGCLAGTTIPQIAPGDRDALEVWADHEQALHRQTIEEMSKECGSYYSAQAIEFLCFFTTPEYKEVAGSAVNRLIDELKGLYEDTYTDIVAQTWESVEDGASCGVEQQSNDHPLLLEAGDPWRFCMHHNRTWKQSEGACGECLEADEQQRADDARLAAILDGGYDDESEEVGVQPFAEGRNTPITRTAREYTRSSGGASGSEEGHGEDDEGGEVINLPQCGKCHTFVLKAGADSCVVCRESAKNDGADATAGAPCTACESAEVKFIVGYAGKNYYYCKACYSTCGKLVKQGDNTISLCHEDTNHMLVSGVRVCHMHARRQSNAVSDTLLRKRGATITEVQ